jgi:phage-related protein
MGGADAEKTMQRISDAADKLGKKDITPKLDIKGLENARKALAEMSVDIDKLNKLTAKPKVEVDGLKDAKVQLDTMAKDMDELGKKTAKPSVEIEKKRFDAQKAEIDKSLDKLGERTVHVKVATDMGGFKKGLETAAVDADGEGENASGGFLTGFSNNMNVVGVGAITAAIIAAMAIAPAVIPAALALGVGVGGALIAGLTHSKLKEDFTKTFHGIMGDLGKDTAPMVKPLESMLAQLGSFVKAESGPLKTMFSASLPFLKMFMGVFEQFAKQLIPALTQSMNMLKPQMPELTKAFATLFDGVVEFIKVLGPGMKPAVSVFLGVMEVVKSLLIGIAGAADGFAYAWHVAWVECRIIFMVFADAVKTIIKVVADVLTGNFSNIGKDVGKIWSSLWHELDGELRAFWGFAGGFIKDIWQAVAGFFVSMAHDVQHIWDQLWKWCSGALRDFWNDCKTTWNALWGGAKDIFNKILHDVEKLWDNVWTWCKNRVKDFVQDCVITWNALWNAGKSVFNNIMHDIEHIWDDLWNTAKSLVKGFVSDVQGIWNGLWDFAKKIFTDIHNDVTSIWHHLWDDAEGYLRDFGAKVQAIWNTILTTATRVFNTIKTAVTNTWKSLWNDLKNDARTGVQWLANAINAVGGFWNTISKDLHLSLPAFKPVTLKFANGGMVDGDGPPQFASGGKVPGQGSQDSVHAMLTPGEAVIPRRVVSNYAPQLKADGIPGFANGGKIHGGAPSGGGLGKGEGTQPKGGLFGTGIGAGIGHALGSVFDSIGSIVKKLKNDAIGDIFNPIAKMIGGAIGEVGGTGGVGAMVAGMAKEIVEGIVNELDSKVTAKEAVGSGSGAQVAAYGKKFVGHKYVLGGSGDYQTKHSPPFGPWDCAGFVSQMYDHFNMGSPTAGINCTALIEWSGHKKDKKPTVGGMAFFAGADGTNTAPGHVGLVTGANEMVNAEGAAYGTRMATLNGAAWFATPPGGFGGPGGYSGKGGTAVYTYLLNNVFDGHRIAATGATASIWGESGWNPESVGTGGNGLIGWTPPRPGIVTGNVTRDLAKQLPMIKEFIAQSGDEGVIREMMGATSVLQAANLWGKGVERYGINDVHSEGISLAEGIAARVGGKGSAITGPKKVNPKGVYGSGGSLTYKMGGMINEPVFGQGMITGAAYSFAENAPEMVIPATQDMHRGGGGSGGGDTFYICPPDSATNPQAYGQTLVTTLKNYKRRNGGQSLNL